MCRLLQYRHLEGNHIVSIEDLNFARDQRNCELAKPPVLYFVDEDGCDSEVELPTHWVVCPVCEGKGKHVNPSIDCNGISPEAFAEDPDFAEDYMRGTYDQTCNKCGGRTTIPAVDLDALDDAQRKAYEQQLRDEADDRACYLAELRMGA